MSVTLRFDFVVPANLLAQALLVGVASALAQLTIGNVAYLYRGRYVIGSFDEALALVVSVLLVSLIGTIALVGLPWFTLPKSTMLSAAAVSTVLMFATRFFWRRRRHAVGGFPGGARTLILGAGPLGSSAAQLMLADPNSQFTPIGFLDDDGKRRNLRQFGLAVLGGTADLAEIAQSLRIDALVVAAETIESQEITMLRQECLGLGIRLLTIPTSAEMIAGRFRLRDIADISVEDLLGRREIKTDQLSIQGLIEDRVILITGAGGSIGSELARQIQEYEPRKMYLLDRDESALHAVQLTLDGSGTLTSPYLILADIRDLSAVSKCFEEVRPELVFHAAALKHLPLLERFPAEAYKTNVIGTHNVLVAASRCGTQTFVNISTDKAADPTSVLGYSKRTTERITAGFPRPNDGKFVSVRFGNVLGSRGSVLHTFQHQISRGGPITVTDRRVTRFFMTVTEAVQLVLQAAVLGSHGETMILDMGQPVKLDAVARLMIENSGADVAISYTGLRPGEKLEEALLSKHEVVHRDRHPLISHTRVEPLNVTHMDPECSDAEALTLMHEWACRKPYA